METELNITDIKNQPCEVKNITLRTRGDNRERTAQFLIIFDYSENILQILTWDKQKWQLKGLFDEDQVPKPGIAHVTFSREFEHFMLDIKRNNADVMGFHCDKLDSFRITPQKGGTFKVQARCFGVCSEGDSETLHKLLRDPGITMSFLPTDQSSELLL